MTTLDIWTVYDHPSDWPQFYVARRFVMDHPTKDIIMCEALEPLRMELSLMGLTCLARSEQDDPVIVETWL